MAETCPIPVYGNDPWRPSSAACGRPSKGTLANGSPACGIHLRVEAVSAAKDAERRNWDQRKEAMSRALGVRVVGLDVDGLVGLRAEDMESVIERLRRAENTDG